MPHSLPGRCSGIDKAPLPPSTFHFPSGFLHQNIVTWILAYKHQVQNIYIVLSYLFFILPLPSAVVSRHASRYHQDIIITTFYHHLHPTCAYHRENTINGMFIAFTSSPFLDNQLNLVMSWSHQVTVIFTSIKALRVPPWQCRSIFQPAWILTKLKQQASLTQGMSAPHRYHANILYQYHLTTLCSAA